MVLVEDEGAATAAGEEGLGKPREGREAQQQHVFRA